MQPDNTTRICRVCGIAKSVHDFGRRYTNVDGISNDCRDCTTKAHRDWTKANPDRWKAIHNAATAKYREKNRDEVRRINAAYEDRKRRGETPKGREYKRLQNALPEVKEAKREWAKRNKETIKHWNRRRLCKNHGITLERYGELYALQNGGCAICGQPERTDFGKGALSLAIDHDHRCCAGSYGCSKCVRGLLCIKCNRGIGAFFEDSQLLQNAIKYLTR